MRAAGRLPEGARWIWVSLPYATFALLTRDGRVVAAAPYGRRYVGRDERVVAAELRARGATFHPLD